MNPAHFEKDVLRGSELQPCVSRRRRTVASRRPPPAQPGGQGFWLHLLASSAWAFTGFAWRPHGGEPTRQLTAEQGEEAAWGPGQLPSAGGQACSTQLSSGADEGLGSGTSAARSSLQPQLGRPPDSQATEGSGGSPVEPSHELFLARQPQPQMQSGRV